ncbi:MAG: hypothetical protein ACI80I_003547, partial [Akkermansiaceae bacterium]
QMAGVLLTNQTLRFGFTYLNPYKSIWAQTRH